MKLEKCRIQGYKSIREAQELEVDHLNVLIGENNTGKSGVIDALRDYQEVFPVAVGIQSEWAHGRNTGKQREGEIIFEFEFLLDEDEHRKFGSTLIEDTAVGENQVGRWLDDGYFREIRHELSILSEPDPTESLVGESEMYANFEGEMITLRRGSLVEGDAEYLKFQSLPSPEYSDQKRAWVELKEIMRESIETWRFIDAFRHPEDMMPARRELELEGDGANLSQVLLTLTGERDNLFDDISKAYAEIMAGVEGIRAPLPHEDKTTVVVDEPAYTTGFDLAEVSAGSKEILTLITQIILSSEGTDLLMIEEPELHLHPGAQREILDLIHEELGDGGPQVIISTHASVFVNHLDVDNIVRVKRDVDTTLHKTKSTEVGGDLRELGYEYAGMFQSEAVVIVEGLTDLVALKCMGKKYGVDFEEKNIGVVEMDGSSKLVNHARSVVKLLGVFNIPFLFICDSDIGEALKDADGNEPETPDEIRGRLIETINGTGNGDDEPDRIGWDKVGPDQIYVWNRQELEAYLLDDRDAIQRAFSRLTADDIVEILEEHSDLDPDEKLEKICAKQRPELDEEWGPMDKKTDVIDLVGEVELENVDDEFHDVMETIADLVGAGDIVRANRPRAEEQ